jgi:hypothetical protein
MGENARAAGEQKAGGHRIRSREKDRDMSKKRGRFRKLEIAPLLKVFRKSSSELKRFEHLEVDGHKIKIEIHHKLEPDAKGFITCPQCSKRNPGNALYCLYCSFIFNQKAQEVPDSGTLEPYQIQCPNCRRIGVRSQHSCLYCGQVFTPLEQQEIPTGSDWQDNIGENRKFNAAVTVTIDGVVYHSTDADIPADIRELMERIRREGYTKEMVDEWVKARRAEQEVDLQRAQDELRDAQTNLWLRIATIGGVVIFFVFILLMSSRR